MVASLEEASKQTSISWPDKREEEEEDDGTNRSGCVVDGVLSPKGTIYCCKHFDSDLAYAQHIVSKMFRCKHGKAYLFDKVSFRVHQAACVHLPPEPCCGAMEILLMICFICLQFKNNLDVLRKLYDKLKFGSDTTITWILQKDRCMIHFENNRCKVQNACSNYSSNHQTRSICHALFNTHSSVA